MVTLAGGGSAALWLGAAAADGIGAAATLAAPSGLAWLSEEGVLLVAEAGGNRLRTLNVTVRASEHRHRFRAFRASQSVLTHAALAQSGLLTTVAGGAAGAPGLADGIGVGALLHAPAQLAASATGGAFLADAGSHALRRVTLAAAALFTRARPRAVASLLCFCILAHAPFALFCFRSGG